MSVILTDKQQEAKERLEQTLRSSPRGNFKSYDEFSEYMQFMIKRIGKKVNLAKAVESGKVSYQEINEKRKIKIKKYYNDISNLKKYGLKYSEKYFPSNTKLFQKLKEKSGNEELAENAVSELIEKGLVKKDEILIKMYFNQYLSQGKNYNKIKMLLTKKLFDRGMIDELIDISKEETQGSLLDPFTLTKKIEGLLKKGKSEYYIIQKFGDTNYDRELIYEILEELQFDNTEVMQRELDKLKRKGFEKQKLITRMFSRGFKYDDFKHLL